MRSVRNTLWVKEIPDPLDLEFIYEIECEFCKAKAEYRGSEFRAITQFMEEGWAVLEDEYTARQYCPDCVKAGAIVAEDDGDPFDFLSPAERLDYIMRGVPDHDY
jgi:hypothetical protein